MSSDIRKQIYDSLNLKETDELVEIWQENDRVEWTEEAFDALREILQQRLGELPPQDEPVLEHSADDLDAEEGEDSENAPVFYQPQQVLRLVTWLNWAAIASIIASVVSGLLELPRLQDTILYLFQWDVSFGSPVAWLIALVVFVFAVGLQSILIYFPLKALGYILNILMEMEFNSRGVK